MTGLSNTDDDRGHNRRMTEHLPSWPTTPPTYGSVVLREFTDGDVHLAFELVFYAHIPPSAVFPAHSPRRSRLRSGSTGQRGWFAERKGLSFAIADAESDNAVGAIGLWLQNMSAGRATVGYWVAPAHRGHGIATSALKALTAFTWTIPTLHRIELGHSAVEQQLESRR